jgi:hypothetical protein
MKPFSRVTQILRHTYTMLNNLNKDGVPTDKTIHMILTDIKTVVDQLVERTAP